MTKETITQKLQPDLTARIITLYNEIMDLRRSGTLITREQDQLREYIKVFTKIPDKNRHCKGKDNT